MDQRSGGTALQDGPALRTPAVPGRVTRETLTDVAVPPPAQRGLFVAARHDRLRGRRADQRDAGEHQRGDSARLRTTR
jgi:hypothetical protein